MAEDEFIRPDEAPSEDEETQALEDALEDSRGLPALLTPEEPPPPLGRGWAFDFVESRFVAPPGARQPSRTFGVETLEMWCLKALHTARGAHAIYPSDYGMREPFGAIGRVLTGSDLAAIEQDVTEALTFHPRIENVIDFDFFQDPNEEVLEMAFTVVLDDDTEARVEGVSTGGEITD